MVMEPSVPICRKAFALISFGGPASLAASSGLLQPGK
jgi:hypothetical protein